MGIPVLSNVTMDLYRGEYSVLFAERIQQKMMLTLEDLLTGIVKDMLLRNRYVDISNNGNRRQ